MLEIVFFFVGYGQERGGIVTKVYNNHWKAIDIVYLENIPWYVPLYYHTLRVTSNGRKIEPRKFVLLSTEKYCSDQLNYLGSISQY